MGIFFSSGGGFSYYNDGGGFEGVSQSLVDPDLWIAVLHATGRKREALTAEKAELLRLWNRGSEQPEADLARSLASLDRFDAAQRLAELHIGEQVDESASPLCADLVSAAHRLGRDVDCERWIANHLSARAAEDVIDSPGRRWSQALFLAKNGGAAELVDAEVRRARELDPKGRHEPSEGDRGWIALATGDAAAASRHFVAGLEEQRLAGRRLEDDAQALRFGLGLALAASEDLDAARPVLLRALAELPNDPFAPRARAVLGL